MELKILQLIVLHLLSFSINLALISDAVNEKDFQNFLQTKTTDIKKLMNRIDEVLLQPAKERENTLFTYYTNHLDELKSELKDRLRSVNVEDFVDETLKRHVHVLKRTNAFNDFYDGIPTDFGLLVREKVSCHYDDGDRCDLAFDPDLKEIISRSKNAAELVFYYVDWRNRIEERAKESFLDYVERYANASLEHGFETPADFHYADYENAEMFDEFLAAIKRIRLIYKHLHAYFRQILIQRHGISYAQETDPIPMYLFEKIQSQTWEGNDFIDYPYIDHIPVNRSISIADQGYETPMRIFEVANDFFLSMGLQNYTNEFWATYSSLQEADEGPCEPSLNALQNHYQLIYCSEISAMQLINLHLTMSDFRYYDAINKLPFGFDREPMPGFRDAIRKAIELSITTPSRYQQMGIFKDADFNENYHINRLFQMAFRTILSTPVYFILENIWVESLNLTSHINELNCMFLKQMEHVCGLDSPIPRNIHNFDMPFEFYTEIGYSTPSHKILTTEILGFQLYRALCIKSGQFNPKNITEQPLHLCNFYGNHEAGNALSAMMSAGRTKTWSEIIEPITGEKGLNATGIMDYFNPLRIWVTSKNKDNNTKLGWILTGRCNE